MSEVENPKEAAGRKKVPLRFVPPMLTLAVAPVMENGAAKYGAFNWREAGVNLSTYVEAALRHLYELLDGADIDDATDETGKMVGTGQPHASCVAACMAIILDAASMGKLTDDRGPPGAAGAYIRSYREGALSPLLAAMGEKH